MKSKAGYAKACLIIKEHPGIKSGQFAWLMWPDSPGWRKMINTGNGVVRGRGMMLAGGSLLGRLRKSGYVNAFTKLTKKGEELLNEFCFDG